MYIPLCLYTHYKIHRYIHGVPPNFIYACIHIDRGICVYICPYIGYNACLSKAYTHTSIFVAICGIPIQGYTYETHHCCMWAHSPTPPHYVCMYIHRHGPSHLSLFTYPTPMYRSIHLYIYSTVEFGDICRGIDTNKTNTLHLCVHVCTFLK